MPGNLFLEYKQALRPIPQEHWILEYKRALRPIPQEHWIFVERILPVFKNIATYEFQPPSPINQVVNADFVL